MLIAPTTNADKQYHNWILGTYQSNYGPSSNPTSYYLFCTFCNLQVSMGEVYFQKILPRHYDRCAEELSIAEGTECIPLDFDDRVQAWHSGDGRGLELHEYLGMTWDEYKEWMRK